jgi:hypothetical protein
MKKLLLVVAFAAVGTIAFAQKPTTGNITVEIGLSSILGTPVSANNPAGVPLGVLKGRYFMSDNMAIRGSFGVGMGSTTTTAGFQETVDKTTGFTLGAGIEKHLSGTSKLSPYLGAEVGFGIASGTQEITNFGGIAGNKQTTTGGGTTNIRLNAMLGADYWIVERVYVGAELGMTLFGTSTVADTETETTVGGVSEKVTVTGNSNSSFGIAPAALGMVRIGLMF